MMQPDNKGRRHQSVAGSRKAAALAAQLILPVLAAVMLTATLLLALHTAAIAAPGLSAPGAVAGGQIITQTAGNNGGDNPSDNGGGVKQEGRSKRDEVVGMVVATPNNSPDGFVGNWQIRIDSRRTQTITVTADTEIDDDFNGPPGIGDWVEVRGVQQSDGSRLARRLRPNRFESGEVVVRLTSSQEITGIMQRYDLTQVDTLLESANIYLFTSDEDIQEDNVLAKMKNDRAIEWAELNYVSEVPADPEGNPYRTWKWGGSDDSGYINQAAFQQVNLAPAQGRYGGEGVIVAVLDTGIDASHPAFVGRLLAGRDMVNDDALPQDGPETGEEPGLAQGHGTHVSGIVAHIAPQSKILPIRVLDVNGRGNTYVLAYAIEWAADNGADVINLSLGSDFDSQVLSNALADAQSHGVVIVAAAGNDNGDAPQYPANFPGVLGVTAVDGDDHKAGFANYGGAWVDLAAPGVGITSTIPLSGTDLYAAWSGTSMAAPFVSGAAALVKQKQPAASAAAVATQLVAKGRDLDAANPQYIGQLGRMLDIATALEITPDIPVTPTLPALYLPVVLGPK
jgi:hypothetical protein